MPKTNPVLPWMAKSSIVILVSTCAAMKSGLKDLKPVIITISPSVSTCAAMKSGLKGFRDAQGGLRQVGFNLCRDEKRTESSQKRVSCCSVRAFQPVPR